MRDKWLGIFLFFLLTNNSKQLLSLINGEDFDSEFNKLVNDINEVNSEVFKNECLEGLLKNRKMLEDLNRAYKSGGFDKEGNEALDEAIKASEPRENVSFDIHMVKPTDNDYPVVMKSVPNAEKYQLIRLDNLMLVPLYQVLDDISEIKADTVIRNGVKCCPTCMKPLEQQPCEDWKFYYNHGYAQAKRDLLCEDCISRAEAVRHRHLIYDDDGLGYSVVRVDEIEQLPSVTPKFTDEEIQKMQELEQVQLDKAYELGKTESFEDWLSTFNTDSATECFTAVQELKKKMEGINEN